MKSKPSRWARPIAVCVGEALLLAGLCLGIRHETRKMNDAVNDVSELRDPSPFRAALMGHLGKIHLGLQGYLNNPDPSLEKQVDESRKDFDALLPDFVKQNPKLFPQTAAEEIQRTFGVFKESLDRTLEYNTRRMVSRNLLETNFTRILYLIDHDLRPLIRKTQADGEERSEALLNIENQARAWHENLDQAWIQATEVSKAIAYENDNRGQTYLELYSRMELLARERKVQKEVRKLWLLNSDLARESFVKENLVVQARKTMDDERAQVISALNRFLPAMPPKELEAKKNAILGTMRLHLAAACGIGLLGLVSLIATALLGFRMMNTRMPIPMADGMYRATSVPPEATLEMDLGGTITAWKPAAEKLYGYSESEMRGESVGKLFESESEIGRLGKELKAAKKATFKTVHKTKAGTTFSVRIEFRPVTDSADQTTAIGLVCTKQ